MVVFRQQGERVERCGLFFLVFRPGRMREDIISHIYGFVPV